MDTVYDEDDGDGGGVDHHAKLPPVSQPVEPQKPKPSLWESFKEKEVSGIVEMCICIVTILYIRKPRLWLYPKR